MKHFGTLDAHFVGDSKSSRKKCRGFIFLFKDVYFFKCHNCQEAMSFVQFMKNNYPAQYAAYRSEAFKSRIKIKRRKFTSQKNVVRLDVPKMLTLDDFNNDIISCSDLDKNHSCYKYLIDRKTPEKKIGLLYYCDDISKIKKYSEKYKESKIPVEPRLVIPFLNEKQELLGFQCRALTDSLIKYVSFKFADSEMNYGFDRVDKTQKVYITEGPLDSLFFENGVASATSDLKKAAKYFDKDKCVLILDNQPRNAAIVKIYRELADDGYSMFIWPKECKKKDITDLVIGAKEVEDWDYSFVKDYVDCSVYSGLTLKLNLEKWIKI